MVAYTTANNLWNQQFIVPYEQALSGQGALVSSYIREQVRLAIDHATGRCGGLVYSTKVDALGRLESEGIRYEGVVKAVLLRAGLKQSLNRSCDLHELHSSLACLLSEDTELPNLWEVVCEFVADEAKLFGGPAALGQRERIAVSLLQAFIDRHPPSSGYTDYVDLVYEKYLEWGRIQAMALLDGGVRSRFAKAYRAGNIKLVAHYLNHMGPCELAEVRKLYPVSRLRAKDPMATVIMSKVSVLAHLEDAMLTGQSGLSSNHIVLQQDGLDQWQSYLVAYFEQYVSGLTGQKANLHDMNQALRVKFQALERGFISLSGLLPIPLFCPPALVFVLLYVVPMMVVKAIQKSLVNKQIGRNSEDIAGISEQLSSLPVNSGAIPQHASRVCGMFCASRRGADLQPQTVVLASAPEVGVGC